MSVGGMVMGHEDLQSGTGVDACEPARWWYLLSTGMDIAEIRVTMSLKGVDEQLLERLLETNSVDSLEELDVLTLRNFLHYLRSL